MSAKKKHYQYDIALEEGVGARLVQWVSGLMVFFVTLSLSVDFAMTSLTQDWVNGLSGSLTVEIKPPLPSGDSARVSADQEKQFNEQVQKILAATKKNPAIAESRVLPRKEVMGLIEPWLGQSLPTDLPLPTLIDLKITPQADTTEIQKEILKLSPQANIDTHSDTLDDVKTIVNTIKLFVLLLSGVVTVLAVTAVSAIVRSKLAIHAQEVETLHLIGASDEYISRQFRQHTLKGTLTGSVLGLLCMVATLLAIGYLTKTIDTTIFPHLKLMPMQWMILIASPILIGSIVAHMTAQATVMKELSKLP